MGAEELIIPAWLLLNGVPVSAREARELSKITAS
jgi:hypothetical protein